MTKVRARVRAGGNGAGQAPAKAPKPGTREWMIAIRPPSPNRKHRLYARLSDEEVAARVAAIREQNPHLQPRDEPLVAMFAANVVKCESARAWQSRTWFLTRSGNGLLAFQVFERQLMGLEQHVVRLATILGLTPESRFLMKIPHEREVDPFKAEELRQIREAARDA